jgi:hypothetical protein
VRRVRRVALLATALAIALPGAAWAGWHAPVRLANGASEPHLALADDGSAIAVWRTSSAVRVAFRAPGGSFGSPRSIARGHFALLRLSAAPSGHAVALWRRGRGRLYASVRPAGGAAFGPARLVAKAHRITFPDVKAAAFGGAVAVWQEQLRSKVIRVRAARLPAGATRFRAPITVKADAGIPRLDVDDAANAVIAYGHSGSGNLGVRRFGSTQGLGAEQVIPAGGAETFRVAVGGAGHALLGWTTFANGLDALHAAYAQPGASFGAPEDLASDLGRLGFGSGVDAHGVATLFWIGLDSGTTNYHLRTATRTATEAFAPSAELGAGYFDYPRLAVNHRGDVIAAWWGDVGQRFRHMAAARPRSAQTFGAPTVLGSAAQGNDFAPDVSIDGTGRGVAVWLANPDRGRRGVGRLYYADYTPD